MANKTSKRLMGSKKLDRSRKTNTATEGAHSSTESIMAMHNTDGQFTNRCSEFLTPSFYAPLHTHHSLEMASKINLVLPLL